LPASCDETVSFAISFCDEAVTSATALAFVPGQSVSVRAAMADAETAAGKPA
jgi:hypothetical protein